MMKLTIKGMHCDACKKLITMELEDARLEKYITSLEVTGENIGTLTLDDDLTEDKQQAVQQVINGIDGYSVE